MSAFEHSTTRMRTLCWLTVLAAVTAEMQWKRRKPDKFLSVKQTPEILVKTEKKNRAYLELCILYKSAIMVYEN